MCRPVTLATCLTVTLGALAPASASAAPALEDAAGLHVSAQRQIDPRLIELTVTSSALATPANIRILLPAGYGSSHRKKRYPVLYLIHGTSGRASDWTTLGGAEQTTAGRPLIVVMPDIAINGNGGGWCTNWWNNGARGQPEWETFHISQLIPWVDHNLRTIAGRKGRAIAGLSQGGFCSTSYPARHPDLFSIALSYSGAPDIAYDANAQAVVTPVINATEVFLDGVPPNSMFGDRATEELNWAAHDPTTLAENLRGMDLLLYTGNGQPGPLDPPGFNPYGQGIEGGVHELTYLFHDRLNALRIPSYLDDYGPGTHTWPYWARDLRQSIGPMMSDFAHPPPTPRQITYTSAESQYAVFGWSVSMHRSAAEFSTLREAGKQGFTLQGSGSATVTTPAVYKRGRRYRVRIRTAQGQTTITTITVRRSRRLAVTVPLGPSNTVQAYAPGANTAVYTSTVTIARVRR